LAGFGPELLRSDSRGSGSSDPGQEASTDQGSESIEHYQFVLINDGGLYGIHGMRQGSAYSDP